MMKVQVKLKQRIGRHTTDEERKIGIELRKKCIGYSHSIIAVDHRR
jgi:hypothetical protein